MTHYELWEHKHWENVVDAPFPPAMMPDIEKFFREVHPTLKPGQDWYPEVFATDLFFPLQRPKELQKMMQLARMAGPPCPRCDGKGNYVGEDASTSEANHYSPLTTYHLRCIRCGGTGRGPVTVMEIGADKGGGLYHWCMCLPTVKNVIACEIRGTPYRQEFERAFPKINFLWTLASLTDHGMVMSWMHGAETPIDVLFIDGDKLGMLKDFDAYLPMMRRPGGIVFIHDIQDHEPYHQFKELMRRDLKYSVILETSEGLDAAIRDLRGEKPTSPHDGWLMHWRGRSCGVGVIHL